MSRKEVKKSDQKAIICRNKSPTSYKLPKNGGKILEKLKKTGILK